MAIRMTEIAQLLAQNATPGPDAAPPANTSAAAGQVTAGQVTAAQIAAQIAASALLTGVARQAIIAAAADAVAQLTGAAGVLPAIAPTVTVTATTADTVNPGGGSDDGPTRDPSNGSGGSGTGP